MAIDPRIVRDWLAAIHVDPSSPEFERFLPLHELIDELTHERPDEALEFILAALAADASNRNLEILSAGPLEDLLVYHGPEVIDRVEAEAKSNPGFAYLLGGVWKNAMADEVWLRIQAVWNRKGWDGIPAA